MSQIIKAVLGPTNTGKTHYAIERMLSYTSGVMGFPLRLLAREVYDRVVRVKGKNQTALITGEERIIPEGARYYLCTAEAMPRHMRTDFVAIDEIQMAADPLRGHVFTEHLLGTRGLFETLFLGADTIEPLIRLLVPEAEIVARPRLSTLTHVKPKKLHKLPPRSAIVAFSATEVYGLAELIRRDRGGAAIVMGALSPRTRNAQVSMYQSGEVDYLIATDAIGMGLNLDLDHIAFADLVKFDGRSFRGLTPSEAGQIAGRAGRFKRDGTFSTVGGGESFDPLMVAQIEEHRFDTLKNLVWRNTKLDFASIKRLIKSLERPTDIKGLNRQRDALDLTLLKELASFEDISALATDIDYVSLLWEVCQIPDFRKLGSNDHLNLCRKIYGDLTSQTGKIDEDLMARSVKRLDKLRGDIDTLADRLANVRIWTYISHRSGWLADAGFWAEETRRVEDRLSDALHDRLTQRFVDRRTAVLLKSLKQRGPLRVDIAKETGRITVEGHEIGTLIGFSFQVDPGAARDDQKTLTAAAESGLRLEISRRSKLFANVGFKTLILDISKGVHQPRLLLEGHPVFSLKSGGGPLSLSVKLAGTTLLTSDEEALVLRKAQEWLDARIEEKLEKLVSLSKDLNGEVETPDGAAPLTGLARGIAYRLLENYGTLNRSEIDQDLRSLDQEARKSLRRFGIRFGATSLYIPVILKPHATELRLVMWALKQGLEETPAIPTPGMVWVDPKADGPATFYHLAGFRTTSRKAVRMDMLERLADAVRPLGSKGDWFTVTPEIMGLVGLSGDDFAAVMETLGYVHESRREAKQSTDQSTPEASEKTVDASDSQTSEDHTNLIDTKNIALKDSQDDAHDDDNVVKPEDNPQEAAPTPTEKETILSEMLAPSDSAKIPKEIETKEIKNISDDSENKVEELDTSAETDFVDRLYFKWKQKRRHNNRVTPNTLGSDSNSKARKSDSGRNLALRDVKFTSKSDEKSETSPSDSPSDSPSNHRQSVARNGNKPVPQKSGGDRIARQTNGNKSDSGRGGRAATANSWKNNRQSNGNQNNQGHQSGKHQNTRNSRTKEPDPDSPFAALAGLKDALSKKT